MDILVALDTSRSMLATDVPPSRLERARLEILALQQKARTDRFGLVAFAGTAFLQCPLTLDDAAFQQILRTVDSAIIPQGGTAIAGAIETALASFDAASEGTKVLILVTDGEDHLDGAAQAAEAAAAKGVRIFTIGVGTAAGELIRVRDESGAERFVTDENGNAIKSRLNEPLLEELARIGNGFYLPLRGGETAALLYERGLEPLPRADFESRKLQQRIERFHWPLAFAILCAVVEWFIPERRNRRARLNGATPAAASALALLLAGVLTASASTRAAKEKFEAGSYGDAQREYERLLEKNPAAPELRYNAGTAALRAGNLNEAAGHFTEAVASRDPKLQQRAFYNLGNTLYRIGEALPDPQQATEPWQRALECFDAALELDPKDEDAKFNREVVAKRLEQLPPPPPQQPQPDEKQNQQDEQKKDEQQQDKQQQEQKNAKNEPREQQPKDQPPSQQNAGREESKDQQKREEKKNGPQPQRDQQRADNSQNKPDEPGKPEQAPQPGEQGATPEYQMMTPQQAEAMLDARKSDERLLIFGPMQPTNRPPAGLWKDW
jgi:Ca-activated chloride channel family protein